MLAKTAGPTSGQMVHQLILGLIDSHGLSSHAFTLQHNATYPLSLEHAAEYEWLDHMKIEGL